MLERVENFPKSQRFVLGQRLANQAMDVMDLLVEATYAREKTEILALANRRMEVLRWTVRMAKDRKLFTSAQFEFSARALNECGRMVGGLGKILASHCDGTRRVWHGEEIFDSTDQPHGLPIGNLTSQFFANFHLERFDHFVKQELCVPGYVRYVDDFKLTISPPLQWVSMISSGFAA